MEQATGVQPIRVGEVVCRIIGKVMLQVVRQDVLEVTDTVDSFALVNRVGMRQPSMLFATYLEPLNVRLFFLPMHRMLSILLIEMLPC